MMTDLFPDIRCPITDPSMQPTSTALLVVDVQIGFVDQHTSHIPAVVERLLPRYRHTFATRFYNPIPSNYRRLIHWNRFDINGPDFPLAFTPSADTTVIDKPTYTCVTPDFLASLDCAGIDEVHICGIDTDICVTKCAVDLFEVGRVPVVVTDACASHGGPELHQAALRILARYIGHGQLRESGT